MKHICRLPSRQSALDAQPGKVWACPAPDCGERWRVHPIVHRWYRVVPDLDETPEVSAS